MNRKEFIRKCSALGLGAYVLPSLLISCSKEEPDFINNLPVNFSGKVLIIGAGAAGLSAGHVLNQYSVDFEILEASSMYGGRIKETQGFADFPIDLGGEWIHTDPSILATLLNDPSANAEIDIVNYRPKTFSVWKDDKLRQRNFFSNFYGEHKFKNTTWFSFYDNHIVPGIRDKIILNSPVDRIDYSGDRIQVHNSNNQLFEADRLILTIPIAILKRNTITFTPSLPAERVDALRQVTMPDGIKVFMEFSERFYPDITYEGDLSAILNETEGEKIYYDAAFAKDSSKNILALFAVGKPSSIYANQPTDQELISYILNELDIMFDGKASRSYLRHITQNWSKEPYIGGSYTHESPESAIATLSSPIDSKIYFAGETYAEDTATVHGAGLSGMSAAETIITGG